jgi:hypothetical protein
LYLALATLTLQLALSFAHVHKHDLAALAVDRTDFASAANARSGPQVAEQFPAALDDDVDHCPICFSGFLLSNSSIPDGPVNPHPLPFAEVHPAFHPAFARVFQPRHPAFLSRAPPAS